MDPALDVSSPFRNEAKASEGNYDQAIEQVVGGAAPLVGWGMDLPPVDQGAAPSGEQLQPQPQPQGTPCSMCGEQHTTARIPTDGMYLCSMCVAKRAADGRPRVFPAGTFRCCPTAQEEGEGGVLRCTACRGWYHLRCVGLTQEASVLLRQYAALSTTKWYCPEPSCCEKMLMRQLKKK